MSASSSHGWFGAICALALVAGLGTPYVARAVVLYEQTPPLSPLGSSWIARTADFEPGDDFTLGSDATITGLEFASGGTFAARNWRIRFYDDNGGQPTSGTGFFEATVLSTDVVLDLNARLHTVSFAGPSLLAGVKYWFTVAATTSGTLRGYRTGSGDAIHQRDTGSGGTTWFDRSPDHAYFRVLGNPATNDLPEPTSALLLVAGLLGVGAARRRR